MADDEMMSSQQQAEAATAAPAAHGGNNGSVTRRRKRHHGKAGGAHAQSKSTRKCTEDEDDDDPTHEILDCTTTLDVNFHDFAKSYPEFCEAWNKVKKRRRGEALSGLSSSSVSFSTHVDSAFNAALTRAILRHNFDLSLPSMPEGYLCPPVPNRLNYVLWLNHLLQQSCDVRYFEQEPSPEEGCARHTCRIGIDIGCGASCIYPLLLTTNRFKPNMRGGTDVAGSESTNSWTFLATDIDERSIQSAQINVKANGLEDRIALALVPKSTRQTIVEERDVKSSESVAHTAFSKSTPGPVMNAVEACRHTEVVASKKDAGPGTAISNGTAKFDFCMTNPPFYATEEEATADRKGDGRSRTSMNLGEGIYPGGEKQFVRDMIADSRELTHCITWYTSMLSKKSSLVELERELRDELGRGAVRTATFVQGKTTRWGIAWTYREVAPRSPATRLVGGLQEFDVEIPSCAADTNGAIDEVVNRFVAYCQWIEESKKLVVESKVVKKDGDVAEMSIRAHTGNPGDGARCTASGSSYGHAFIIDISMKAIEANKAGLDNNAESKSLVSVKLQCCYCHSASGLAAIETFRNSLEGEIKRCNRRWRRILARNGAEGINE